MGRKKSASPATSSFEPPKRDETCSECGHIGQVGSAVVPYSFAKGDYRWLCWAGARDCMVKAWGKFRSANQG